MKSRGVLHNIDFFFQPSCICMQYLSRFLLDSKGNILSELYFTNSCNIQTNFLEYYGLVNSILEYK